MSRSNYGNAKVDALLASAALSNFTPEDLAALSIAACDQAGADCAGLIRSLDACDLVTDEVHEAHYGEPRGAGDDPHGRSVAEGDFCE